MISDLSWYEQMTFDFIKIALIHLDTSKNKILLFSNAVTWILLLEYDFISQSQI